MQNNDGNRVSKGYHLYLIEFIVIVVGVSTSFWVEDYRESLQHRQEEEKVLQSLLSELEEIQSYCQQRDKAFAADRDVLLTLLDASEDRTDRIEKSVKSNFNIQIALYDYRGFQPPSVRYNSIINEGSFKYVQSDSIKKLINELNTTYLSTITGNVQQEKNLQHQIVMHLAEKHPLLIIEYDGQLVFDRKYVEQLEQIIDQDDRLRALIKMKTRFIKVKIFFLQEYIKMSSTLQEQIESEIQEIGQ